MPEDIDWTLATHERTRGRQHQEFLALSFREKLLRIEELGEVVAYFEARRLARATLGVSAPGQVSPRKGA